MTIGFGALIGYGICIMFVPHLALAILFFQIGGVWGIALGITSMFMLFDQPLKERLAAGIDSMFHFLTGKPFVVEKIEVVEKLVEVEKVVVREKIVYRDRVVRVPTMIPSMTAAEAFECLGVPITQSKDEIRRGYLKMMQKVHPDHGGSQYLTRVVIQARAAAENSIPKTPYQAGMGL